MYKYLLVLCLLAGCILTAEAQTPDTTKATILKKRADSSKAARDTDVSTSPPPKIRKEKVYHPDSTHSPHKAVMRSLIIPGWGQVYNHKIWKVPVVYGVLGLLGSAIIFNAHNYNEFLALSEYRYHLITPKKGDPYYDQYNQYSKVPDQSIYDAKDGYRRNRDLSILGVVVFWGVNAIDAYIDAKFIHSYTLDNNFSMKVTPGIINQPVYAQNFTSSYIPGIKIIFTL